MNHEPPLAFTDNAAATMNPLNISIIAEARQQHIVSEAAVLFVTRCKTTSGVVGMLLLHE